MAPGLDALQSLQWRCLRFDALSVFELHDLYLLRQQVFCVEQACPYLDIDGVDEHCRHLAAWRPGQRPLLACARIVAPGMKYAEPSIGRVATAAAVRGTGVGRELVRRAIVQCRALHPGWAIRISAQSHLEAFYADADFVVVGERYLEDGIPHTEMLLDAAPAAGP